MILRTEELFGRVGLFRVKKITNKLVLCELVQLKDGNTPFCGYDLTYLLYYSSRVKQNTRLLEGDLLLADIKEVLSAQKAAYIQIREEEPTHGVYLCYCPSCKIALDKDNKYQDASCSRCGHHQIRKYSILYQTLL